MQRRVGQINVESIAAERAKFTAPLLLIHGLWCTAAVWRKSMGYFAHRGWDCYALTLRGHTAAEPPNTGTVHLADHLDDVGAVIAACDAAPVLIGHDFGATLALHLDGAQVRATVALAPLLPARWATTVDVLFAGLSARLARLRARPLRAPRGALGERYFAQGVPAGTVPESSAVARDLAQPDFQLPDKCSVPTLVMAGDRDPFCTPPDAQRFARHVGATFVEARDGHHALPWAPGWEQRVSDVHRWLIKALGEDLLLPPEEES